MERIHSHVLIQFKLRIENIFNLHYVNKKNYRQKDNSRGYIAPPVNVGWRQQSEMSSAISYTHVHTPYANVLFMLCNSISTPPFVFSLPQDEDIYINTHTGP